MGNNEKGKNRSNGDHGIPNLRGFVGVNHGINLAGISNPNLDSNVNDLEDVDALDEDRPFESICEKNRPRTNYVLQVSNTKYSSEILREHVDVT